MRLVLAIDVALDEYGASKIWLEASASHARFVAATQACLPFARVLGYEDEVAVLERFALGAAPLARAIKALQQARRHAEDPPMRDVAPAPARPRVRRPPVTWRRFVRSR